MSSSSAHGHAGGGTGSSSGGHGSSNGHKTGTTGSSSGHTRASQALSSQGHAPLIGAPSSLLPTQKHAPSSYVGDEESGRSPRRASTFLGRSLRGLRIRSPRHSVVSLSGVASPPASASPAASSANFSASPRVSMAEAPSTGLPPSIVRPLSPSLGTLPRSPFAQVPVVNPSSGPGGGPALGPHAVTASGLPVWPGLTAALGQLAMPSPAPTEGSSVNAPEGLLDPRFAHRPGMQSQGALSFRDDMDYSRPIGGLVNNRQYSRTTIQTMSTLARRPSMESHDTATGGEMLHHYFDDHPPLEPPAES
ncbi:hypothetical protein C2E23DRAFT_724263 [Lenzites betulinus]|nr:hypothetical protein C2E23DRAFT_724263 [Lenzites betulinus]